MSRFQRGSNLASPERLNRLKQRRQARKQAEQRKRNLKIKKGFLAISKLAAVTIAVLIILSSLVITGVNSDYRKDYLASYFESRPLQRMKLLFNEQEFSNYATQDPIVNRVELNIPLVGNKLGVEVELTQAVIELKARNGTFLVNQSGVITGNSSDEQQLILFEDTELTYQAGDQALSTSVITVVERLSQLEGFKKVSFKNDSATSLSVRVGEVDVYISLIEDLEEQINRYNQAKSDINAQEYIDLRVDDKVFYR